MIYHFIFIFIFRFYFKINFTIDLLISDPLTIERNIFLISAEIVKL